MENSNWEGGLNHNLARLFLLVGLGLPLLGIPVALILDLNSGLGFLVRILASSFFYLITALLLHPGVWERLPLKYMPGRVRTAAFVTFAAGTAIWDS